VLPGATPGWSRPACQNNFSLTPMWWRSINWRTQTCCVDTIFCCFWPQPGETGNCKLTWNTFLSDIISTYPANTMQFANSEIIMVMMILNLVPCISCNTTFNNGVHMNLSSR